MNEQLHIDRRNFFKTTTASCGIAAIGTGVFGIAQKALSADFVMSPNEDLMQEHALLNRTMLIYEECIRRIEELREFDPTVLKKTAQIIQSFVENYHEKDEENYVFPRFEKAGKMVDLVKTLREQHAAGRKITQNIIDNATLATLRHPLESLKLVKVMKSFIRMYRPHETREGSELFPAFRDLLSPKEFNDLGAMFEEKEHEQLGPEGFEGQVKIVAGFEAELGINDLSQFTPRDQES